MIEKKFKWQGETGLHARPAGLLVNFVNKYQDNININIKNIRNNNETDARGLFGLMGLEVEHNDEILITINNSQNNNTQETEILEELKKFFVTNNFAQEI